MTRSGLLKLRGFVLHGLVLAAALFLVSGPALADKRVALILGNSNYQNVPALSNPINDGGVMAATFRNAGFDVVSRYDLSALDTRRVLRDFADRARDADVAVIYYAGHGMEVDGTNYLIPVDAKLERDADIYDEAFSLDRILVAVEPVKQLRLVILDACRDNPFARTMKHSLASRSIGRGLAKIEPASPNTLIAYSAKAGSTAQDGDGKNSPFTVALSQHLTKPGLDVRKAFGFVRDDVLKSTGNRQEPFVYGSLGGNDVPLVPARAAPEQSAVNPQAETRRDYELALQVGNKAAMNAFLAQHPDGFYASLAKLQLEKITAEETHAAAVAKARVAEQERARLAAEGAKKEAQAKADADATAAETARLAAEKAQQVAQQQAAEGERQRTERITSNPVVATNGAADTPLPSAPAPAPDKGTNVASLSDGPSQADLTKSVQGELRRVGCLKADADGDWNTTSQRSLTLFNRYAKTKLDTEAASNDTLDTIKQQPSRVCPLVCEHGFKADGDRCTRIVCAEGSFLNDDNECEKRRGKTPVAKRDEGNRRDRADRTDRAFRPDRFDRPERASRGPGYDIGGGADLPPRRPQASTSGSGQIVCDSGGCRTVRRGCHLEYRTLAQGGPREGGGGNVEICN
ncbi:MAG TPA: caspase family protein [Bradyrhizobium sp.]|nr:caspase family protein [Bradyrhizobium sp.]